MRKIRKYLRIVQSGFALALLVQRAIQGGLSALQWRFDKQAPNSLIQPSRAWDDAVEMATQFGVDHAWMDSVCVYVCDVCAWWMKQNIFAVVVCWSLQICIAKQNSEVRKALCSA